MKQKVTEDDITIAKSIKKIRKHLNIQQDELGEYILASPTKISRAEIGKDRYTEQDLILVKEFLKIEGMPLTHLECKAFVRRLYIFRDLIIDKMMPEVEKMIPTLKNVINLESCNTHLPKLYQLFEVIYLIRKNDILSAKEKLDKLGDKLSDMNTEHLYYYYTN